MRFILRHSIRLRVWLCLAMIIGGVCITRTMAQVPNPDPALWTIFPDLSSGPISATVSESDLKRIYGEKNVVDRQVYLGEGESEMGTALFPDDPEKMVEILWKDKTNRRSPREVRVGNINARTSLWHTVSGISIGTSLKRLEQLNGRPFRLTGFHWDYAGTVLSWSQGKLSILLGSDSKNVFLRLGYGDAEPPEAAQVVGDREYSSGHPAMQAINPRIYQMLFIAPGY